MRPANKNPRIDFIRILHLPVCVSLLTCSCNMDGPTPGDADDRSLPSTKSITGSWVLSSWNEDGTVVNGVPLTFLQLNETSQVRDKIGFEVVDPCDPTRVIGEGVLDADDRVQFLGDGGDLEGFVLEFTGENRLKEVDAEDDSDLELRRIVPPTCSVVPTGETATVDSQVLEYYPESLLLQAPPSQCPDASGSDNLSAAKNKSLPLNMSMSSSDPATAPICRDTSGMTLASCPDLNSSHAGFVECRTQTHRESAPLTLDNALMIADSEYIYPGSLVQGASYFDGRGLRPITIPRAGSTLTISGLTLGNVNVPVSEISLANVSQALNDRFHQDMAQATAANFTFLSDQAYSSSQWAFKVGIDVTVAPVPVSIAASLSVGSDSYKNNVVARFNQVYYSVTFPPPDRPFSVFKDGECFEDPDGQIGADNPPLYVSNVSYGRQVYFFVQSSYGSNYVEAALKAAGNFEGAAKVELSSGLTYKQIMSNSTVSYSVRGGDANTSLQPITAPADQIFDKIKEIITNNRVTTFSLASPAVPVAYSLRYLSDNSTPQTSLDTEYQSLDCRTIAERGSIQLQIINPLETLRVYLGNTNNQIAGPYSTGTNTTLNLDQLVPLTGTQTLIFRVSSDCGKPNHASWFSFNLLMDGARVLHDDFYRPYFGWQGGDATCRDGLNYEARILVNRTAGTAQLISRELPE